MLLLPSGVQIPFRDIRPDDAPALQRLHSRCSERTVYLRFFSVMKELSDEQARYFASTDGADHFGLVALDATRYLHQPTSQGYPYPVALPAILDDGRVLGLLFPRWFAVVAHYSDDLVLIEGI
jgi:hypothetical protein